MEKKRGCSIGFTTAENSLIFNHKIVSCHLIRTANRLQGIPAAAGQPYFDAGASAAGAGADTVTGFAAA